MNKIPSVEIFVRVGDLVPSPHNRGNVGTHVWHHVFEDSIITNTDTLTPDMVDEMIVSLITKYKELYSLQNN